jgi:hypothetical protein
MRSISATLLAAQRAASGQPYVSVIAENRVDGVVRLDPEVADTTANTIAAHGAGVVATLRLLRARMDAGAVKHSMTSNVGSPISTTWSTDQTGKGTQLAVATQKSGSRAAIVYTDAAGTGIKIIESTDSATTFGAEAAVVTAPAAVTALAACYDADNSGDMLVAWCEAAALKVIRRVAGVWGAAATSPTAVQSYSGVAVMHDTDYRIIATGVEQTTLRPTLWTLAYGDGFDYTAGTWTAYNIQQQAESDAAVTYRSPFLGFVDTYVATYVEVDAFSGGATRAWRTGRVFPLTGLGAGAYSWRTPTPVDYGQLPGLALATAGNVYIESAPDRVLRELPGLDTTDLSARVLAVDVTESDRDMRGHVDIDNTDGAYAGPPAPIAVGNQVTIGFGYTTTAGNEASTMAEYEIRCVARCCFAARSQALARLRRPTAIEYRRTGGISIIRLVLAGGWARLRRDRQRTSIVHAGGSLTYGTIISRLFSRGGMTMFASAPSSRAGTVKPAFQIAPQTNAYDALRQALQFIADRIIMKPGNTALLTEPLASDTTDYTFGTDHAVYDSEIALLAPPAAEAYAYGAGTFGEAIDYPTAQQRLAPRAERRDLTSTTPAAAAATAAAHLRQLQLDQPAGELRVPPCCGLEVLDVIDITDTYIASAAVTRRVRSLRWRYDAIAGGYEQHIALGAV